ncbi:cytochrome c3 family protein [Anaeromyxobacter paludicola]|nr:cytochrome c3 family protein [Anaeromyxobacter paludicola]
MLKTRLFLLTALLAFTASRARAGIPAEQDDCLGCHGGDKSMTMDLPSGEKLPIYVDTAVFAKSVHGEMLRCADCHSDKNGYPHNSKPFKNRRDVTVAYYEQCKACHFANYTKTLDGVHFAVLAKGNQKAALCVDCHGSHDITRPTEPRARISATCAGCHQKESDVYVKSVHGKALAEQNQDVPVCTDCHRAHDIADPRDGKLSMRTPEVCGRCHTNEKLMAKYGLSTHVVDSYLSDFHGMSASLQRKTKGGPKGMVAAVCTDCHGVHDILSAKDPTSHTVKANLVQTCRKCHPGANENFPSAWLSHYQPSWNKASLVYGVQLFYKFLIPFILGSLAIQIVIHLWRVVVNR